MTPTHPSRGVVAVFPKEVWFQNSLSPAECCHVGIRKSFKVPEPVLLFSWAPGVRESVERCLKSIHLICQGFPGSSAGKESACNAGDLGSIPGSGRIAEEGIGYSLQHPGQENAMVCTAHGVTKSGPQQSAFILFAYLAGCQQNQRHQGLKQGSPLTSSLRLGGSLSCLSLSCFLCEMG